MGSSPAPGTTLAKSSGKAMDRLIRKRELIGIAVIASLGSVMHFAFEWSGELRAMGAFAAVNEKITDCKDFR